MSGTAPTDAGIRHWVARHRRELVDTLRHFVAIPSENRMPYGDEYQAQEEVARYLRALGFQVDMFSPDAPQGVTAHPAFMAGRDYRSRPCVVGRRPGTGGGRSLLLSGHMDTVGRGLDQWLHPPFLGQVKDGRLYGLGAYDMKGGLVAGLLAYRCLVELGVTTSGDVLFESVVDEEFGGANGTLAGRVKGYAADLAVVPEPTGGIICPTHRAGAMLRFSFERRDADVARSTVSSTSRPNPIAAAARYVALLQEFNDDRNRRPAPALYKDNPEQPLELFQIKAGDTSYAFGDRNPNQCYVNAWVECDPTVTEQQLLQQLDAFMAPRIASDSEIGRAHV